MKKTNEMKFSSYGVWDLLRKVYQNKKELLPKLGFKKYEEFLDWMKTGDQDTQDEFESIIKKHETEKIAPMTEDKLKQTIKEEIKRILNENKITFKEGDTVIYMGEEHLIISDDGYTVKLKPNKGEIVTLNYSQAKEKVRKQEDFNESYQLYNLAPKTPEIDYDINPMFKSFLNTANNIGGKITLPTRDTGPEDYTILNNVNIGREGRLSFFVPNPKKKSIGENSDQNKNSMIRGMMSMLKSPEIKNASFEDLMNLNVAIQQLMPNIQRPDYDSPSNVAAIKAMRDMDREK